MGLRRWGAVAATALVLAGCGSTVGGQALPARPVLPSPVISPSTVGPTATSATGSSSISTGVTNTGVTNTGAASTGAASTAVAPFPDQSVGTTASSSGNTSSGSTSSGSSTSSAPTASTADGSTVDGSTASSPSPTTAAPSTTVKWLLPLPKGGAAKVNKFGNVIATPGQSFGIQWRSNQQIAVVFIVDSLQVDRGCEVPVKPANGHMVVISVRAQLGYSTGIELSDDAIGFTDSFWTVFDAKDTAQVDAESAAAQACVTYKTALPYSDSMEPDKVYSGKIALDVSSATGTAVLMNSLDGGWLYRYG